MNWTQTKILFYYISGKNYTIKKETYKNDILYINWNNFSIKCKYFLVFYIDTNNNIIWSCDNPYIDQKTIFLSNYIRNIFKSDIIDKTFNSETINFMKKLIKNNTSIIYNNTNENDISDEKINLLWFITGNYKNHKQFYIITDIIYFK